MMKTTRIAIGLLGTGYALGLAVAPQLPRAEAAYRRVSGSVCQPMAPGNPHGYETSDTSTSVYSDATFGNTYFVCPVLDNSDLPKASITKVKAIVIDNNNTPPLGTGEVAMRICSWDTTLHTGLACGSQSSTWNPAIPNFTGRTTINMGNIVQLSGHTPYLYVTLPARQPLSSPSSIASILFET